MRKQAIALALAAACAASSSAAAQNFPSKPITIIVPFAAGGPSDVLARTLAERMRVALGQPLIVENVAGAAGTIGVARVVRAPADGYTISFGHLGTHVINGAIYLVFGLLNGHFRRDLLFRLNTIEIHLPPLRERREDIPLLAAHFLRMHASRYRKQLAGFDPAAMKMLQENPWQGNVRELNHVVERAVLMSGDHLIRPGDLAVRAASPAMSRLEEMSIEEVECFLIRKALQRHDGNVSHAAKVLGLSRSALYRRLQRYGL